MGYYGSVGNIGYTGSAGSFTGTTTSSVFINNVTASTGTNTGALTVTGGVGIGGNLNVGGDIIANKLTIQLTTVTTTYVTTDDIISTYNTTASTGTNTGALVVAGGVGIGGDLNVGGTITGNLLGTAATATNAGAFIVQNISSNTVPRYLTFVSTTTGYVTGETSATGLTYVANRGLGVGAGSISPVDSQSYGGKVVDIHGPVYARQSTSPSTYYLSQGVYNQSTYINAVGANNNFIWQVNNSQKMFLSNAGYFGIGVSPVSDLHLQGAQFRHNDTTGFNTYTFTLSAGVVQLASTATLVLATNNVSITSTVSSTSTVTGALTVTGGVGIGGSVNIGQTSTIRGAEIITTATIGNYSSAGGGASSTGTTSTFLISNTSSSTSTVTGALVVTGGVGIGGNLNVGGTITGGGVRSSTTTTTPTPANVGDIWYYQGTDAVYRYEFDGFTTTWIDITGPSAVYLYGGNAASRSGYLSAASGNNFITPSVAWDAATPVPINDGATITIDLSSGMNFICTLTNAVGVTRTLNNFVNAKAGQTGWIQLIQSATGNNKVTFGTNWHWALGTTGTISTSTVNGVDILFYTVLTPTYYLGNMANRVV
jgi:hypothetical protein